MANINLCKVLRSLPPDQPITPRQLLAALGYPLKETPPSLLDVKSHAPATIIWDAIKHSGRDRD